MHLKTIFCSMADNEGINVEPGDLVLVASNKRRVYDQPRGPFLVVSKVTRKLPSTPEYRIIGVLWDNNYRRS